MSLDWHKVFALYQAYFINVQWMSIIYLEFASFLRVYVCVC